MDHSSSRNGGTQDPTGGPKLLPPGGLPVAPGWPRQLGSPHGSEGAQQRAGGACGYGVHNGTAYLLCDTANPLPCSTVAAPSGAHRDPPAEPANPCAEAWAEYLGRWPWQWFVTLTFRADVHPEAADKRFRSWLAAVERERNRVGLFDGGLRWVRALEYQRRGVIHFHVLLGNVGALRYATAHEHWREGHAWIEPVRDSGAVRAYVAKYVAKGGEIDLGGDGMSRPDAAGWPSRTFSRGKVRAALAGLTAEERAELMHWVEHDGRPSTRPAALLERAKAAVGARHARNDEQLEFGLAGRPASPRTPGRVYGPESGGGVPQTVRHGAHPQDLGKALSPAGAAD